ncbi:hypothetical protein A2Y85_05305 [candidate division WOR-3 bacterium RBG_13_43_14]|uniref:Squalene cyclase C-terminal domain-containing protein n=1 Tax=candidate division WOR-3 bacterium RBG_13_43_14 TaxID=1802590 RepID=A0A1F4U1K6_UNCW3|nr:MAG: hypothetical protein A2Y85_05305 [candidate division WOR-3 bacterium RBG_13_43_14]
MSSTVPIEWLLKGDVSIQHQVHRDLLRSDAKILLKLQNKIAKQGWGARFLSKQRADGHWGRGFYQPKWTSTHYTLLDLKNIGLPSTNEQARKSTCMIFDQAIGPDGGINYSNTPATRRRGSDLCIDGMVLNIASYFRVMHAQLKVIINLLLSKQMKDGGWNCAWHYGAVHSSLHTTISVLEGFLEYRNTGSNYQIENILKAEKKAVEFILKHYLCKSHRTGEIIDAKMLMLSYPSRWRYDVLRALDYLQFAEIKFDARMRFALEVILKKQAQNGKWPLQMKHTGAVHFDMEKIGQSSRWNTLRVLRVMQFYSDINAV